ncbi:hypothetical protein QQF64_029915 [Cirrhinus molitorella]|uniref:Uncharacterized protein n=1 Tax=Cirrhinus molitorella TaxID=172907 RepID=A0ABR3N1Y8_9TELE
MNSWKYPNAFTACVITRAKLKKANEVSLSDSFLCIDQEAEERLEDKSYGSDQVGEVIVALTVTLQESLKFSPSELVFGHAVKGSLKVLKERMLGIEDAKKTNVLDTMQIFCSGQPSASLTSFPWICVNSALFGSLQDPGEEGRFAKFLDTDQREDAVKLSKFSSILGDVPTLTNVLQHDINVVLRMEDCVDSVGSARFVSKLDLLKGYWQVPLTSRASEISAFVTPDCFLQYKAMVFGLRNAADTFQRFQRSGIDPTNFPFFDEMDEVMGERPLSNVTENGVDVGFEEPPDVETSNEAHISVSDMWSSSNMTPYMSLTIHYITADWTLQSKCLETRYIPEHHTADVLAEAELDESKMACITTDNGANIVAAVRNLGWSWLNCFEYNLHLAVSHGLDCDKDRTERAMGLCRNLVNTLNLSWLKKRDLRKAQTETNVSQHNLVLVSEDRKHGHLNPTWQDVSVLESINAAMKPVADFTDVLSGEKYVTVSSVKPVLELLKGELLSPDPSDTTLTANIKANMCRVLTEKYSPSEIQNLLTKATVLDPRYRGTMEDAEVLDDVKEKLLQELLDMNGEEGKGESASVESCIKAAGRKEGSESEPPATKKKRLCDLLQNRRTQLISHQTQDWFQKECRLMQS